MNELALFAGAGGGILGGHLLGWRTVCAVEYDRYARSVLIARQNDGTLEPFPIWDDVRTFDGRAWRGRVDVVSGGFPCQDISAAGKGKGITGERSGLWSEMARIVGEVRPRFVWVENSPLLRRRGLGLVLLDLAKMGFSARWGIVGAHHAGAPHKRDRIWVLGWDAYRGDESEIGEVQAIDKAAYASGASALADANGAGCEAQRLRAVGSGEAGQACLCGRDGELADAGGIGGDMAYAYRERSEEQWREMQSRFNSKTGWWDAEPDLGRVADGVAARVDRLRCIGNGQVPAVVRLAWEALRCP